jgi:hypothetical protein
MASVPVSVINQQREVFMLAIVIGLGLVAGIFNGMTATNM